MNSRQVTVKENKTLRRFPNEKSQHFAGLSPELSFTYMRMQSFFFWIQINFILFLFAVGLIYIIEDANITCINISIIGYGMTILFLINTIFNLYMFLKTWNHYTKEYEKLCNDNNALSAGYNKKKSNDSRWLFNKQEESNFDASIYYDIMKLRPPSSFPWESALSNQLFFKEASSKELKNEVISPSGSISPTETSTDKNKSSPDRSSMSVQEISLSQQKDSQVSMRDDEIPLPTLYPLFKRRKEKYLISDWDEAKELMKDFKQAIRDNPISFCFHPGQIEKYMQYLPVPKDSGYRDFQDMWQRLNYQTSPIDEKNYLNLEDPFMFPINNEVWRKFKINPKNFVNWVANLRVWIAKTLLHNIVEEIDIVNSKLKTVAPTISVGNVGLDDLISTARNTVITTNVPSLAILLPYLQISTNQRYIIQRLRDLAIGNTMSDFSWKSGGKIDDKAWEPHLPSDAELIMHLIVTYFDSRMPISIESPDRKPFSSYYFAKNPDNPPQSEIVICQQSTTPPYYQLIMKNEICSLPSGAYNMFFAILLFVQYIKMHHNGVVGRMYLGQSGLNLLWTIEDVKV